MTELKTPRSETEWSRRAIINVVDVLAAHADSLTLIGAHAVLLRTADLDVPQMRFNQRRANSPSATPWASSSRRSIDHA